MTQYVLHIKGFSPGYMMVRSHAVSFSTASDKPTQAGSLGHVLNTLRGPGAFRQGLLQELSNVRKACFSHASALPSPDGRALAVSVIL